jgi:4-amino-4-deoxy-L-arabinose transferase-like glycosyltransferase
MASEKHRLFALNRAEFASQQTIGSERGISVSVETPFLEDQVTLKLPTLAPRRARLRRMRPWHWAALTIVIAFSAFLNFFQLQQNGYGNLYYAPAVKSMLLNWHNFFFVSFDPAGFVTVDKPPVDLWLQTLSAKILGFSGFSLMLPQALAGVITVVLVFHLVRRSFGPGAGLISALAMATTPIAVAISRSNNLDMMLVMVVVFAAWAVIVAAEKGQLRWLLLGAVLVGIGFNVKMLEAYLTVPALGLLYLLAAPRKWWVRLSHLGLALLVLLAISLSWVLTVDLTPAADRPYVDSTTSNSELDLALGYNGINRLVHTSGGKKPPPEKHTSPRSEEDTSLQPPLALLSSSLVHLSSLVTEPDPVTTATGGSEIGSAGPLRLLTLPLAGQIGWLIPLALLAMLTLAWHHRWHWPLSVEQQALVFWGTWLLVTLIFFSMAYAFHAYYIVTMAPAISALTGIGLVTLWHDYRSRSARDWRKWMLPLVFVPVVASQVTVLVQYPGWSIWMSPLLIVLAALSALALVLIPLFAAVLRLPQNVAPAAVRVVMLPGILALLFSSLVWSSISLTYPAIGGSPLAGPRTMDVQQAWAELAKSEPTNSSSQYTLPKSEQKLVNYLLLHHGNTTFLFGTLTSSTAAPFILATGQAVMSLGGYGGNDPILTIADLHAHIVSGDIRFFLFPFNFKVKKTATSEIEEFSPTGGQNGVLVSWVAEHCQLVPALYWENGRYVTVQKGKEKLKEFRPWGIGEHSSNTGTITRLYDCANISA